MRGCCPLCASRAARPSWLGSLQYDGREYPYAECASCGSLYADPMPDERALARMYGPEYMTAFKDDAGMDDPKEPERVVEWLRGHPAGTFIDYGCGAGRLLSDVARIGWRAVGVEFDPDVAAGAARATGCRVADRFTFDTLRSERPADVLHLGDVIEHLTDPDTEMPRIISLIKPGGFLVAQGPLEANATLFTAVLKAVKRARGRRVSDMAPYHVMLATARGQQAFFARFGLTTTEFSMHEVAWPAPSRLTASDLVKLRSLGLFLLRRVSQLISALRPSAWGNRYFYIGRVA